MRTCLLWCITLYLLCHPRAGAQAVTTKLPPASATRQAAIAPPPSSRGGETADLPDAPSLQSSLPEAQVVPPPPPGVPVRIVADDQQRVSVKNGNLYTLNGNVVFYYRDYIIHADHVVYNDSTGEVFAQGHLMIDGGPDDEHFLASHGMVNVQSDTGDFFNVVGTLGVRRTLPGRMVFTAPNPFALTGREVLQLGKGHYRVIHGTMTSCRLPRPDWRILSHVIEVNNGVAKTGNSVFELLGVPLLYMPYVTHAVESQRQSGILIPYFGNDTTKGLMVGEGFYLTLGRSADLTVASQWWSKRGFAPNGMFRYRGTGANFLTTHFESLLDRGYLEPNGHRLNQGGVDIVGEGKYAFSPHLTGVLASEYLSSYIYRLVFEEEYAVAIDSEVKSAAFVTHENHDFWESLRINRYQNFESSAIPADEVRILHLPELDMDTAERPIGDGSHSFFHWSLGASAAALSRYDYPSFRTTAEIPRIDFHPDVSLPLHFAGWSLRPQAAIRETWYGKSQHLATLEQIPVVKEEGLTRTDEEAGFELRPPALERDFASPWLVHLLGGDLRHVIEPDLHYRYVTGINNFRSILRFDDVDVASDTNELEYGLTQRFFVRASEPHPCTAQELQQRGAGAGPPPYNANPAETGFDSPSVANAVSGGISSTQGHLCGSGTRDWITWRVAQKHYFQPDFGDAVTLGTPNPLETTLDFTGVDFITSPRHNSPVISRLRVQTSSSVDLEWDLDYDVQEGKITSSNVFTGYQHGLYRFQFGDSYMNVPLGTTPLSTLPPVKPPSPDQPDPYNQIHVLATHGAANRLGLSEGVTAAYDLVHQQLQYGAFQAQYNLNCCGLDFQYRRFSLGGIRNDSEYFYSINFAGISNIGDLTHRISLF